MGLQRGLDCMYQFCKTWHLKINVNKSKIIIFRKGIDVSIKAGVIEITKFVYPMKFLIWHLSLHVRLHKSRSRKHWLSKHSRVPFHFAPTSIDFVHVIPILKNALFRKIITHLLDRGCEVWGFHQDPDVEWVHLRFSKRITGVKNRPRTTSFMTSSGKFH